MLLTQNCLNFEINKSQACFQNSKIRISILMQLFSKEFNNLKWFHGNLNLDN